MSEEAKRPENMPAHERAFCRISDAHNETIKECGHVPTLVASIALGTYAASLVPPY